jgi:glutamate-5-semialdehyde dehydrogenase
MPRNAESLHNQTHTLREQIQQARKAARSLARMTGADRNRVLLAAAKQIEAREAEIVAANERDCAGIADAVAAGTVAQALAERLRTKPSGIREMAVRIRDVARLQDPLANVIATTELDDGLTLYKIPCPLGVIAVIFESRPDVVPQVGSLAIKSGNGLVLKGGSEARHTNRVLTSIWRDALCLHDPVLADAICLIEERAEVLEILTMEREIDLVVPRGSTEFVHFVFQHSRIPVLGHGSGVCHIYVDAAADLNMAREIIVDAKVQYPAACNSVEKVLVHENVAVAFLAQLVQSLQAAGVEVRACNRTKHQCRDLNITDASEEDWWTEYCDLKITIKVVSSLQDAIEHINHYGSRHTECIVSEDQQAAQLFMDEVDAASVLHNASTRFADGFRYGLGAELGISTSKLHARGPVGMEGMLTYKYKLHGSGHVVSDYAQGKRTFKHRHR